MERFTAEIELYGKTATGFMVPPEVVASLGRGKRPPVVVELNEHAYRTTIAAYGNEFFVPLNRKNREAAGVAAGDRVEVAISLDAEPRTIEPPDDLAAALSTRPDARVFFDELSYSHRREYVEWIEEAKRAETRARRIAKALDMLARGESQR
jgi:hypothetical protein